MGSEQWSSGSDWPSTLAIVLWLSGCCQSVGSHHTHVDASDPLTDVVDTLASKVLHTSLFAAMAWSSCGIQPAKVFHLAGRILEGKTTTTSLIVAQATVDPSTT